jgi:hypothetical protein
MDMLINGQRSGGGEYGTIPISGFTTVGSGQVNMKLGVLWLLKEMLSAQREVIIWQYQNLMQIQLFNTNYLTLNHAGNSKTNFFNSSIFPVLPHLQKQPDFTKQYRS